MVGVFRPGRHAISSSSLPLLEVNLLKGDLGLPVIISLSHDWAALRIWLPAMRPFLFRGSRMLIG